PPAPPAAAQVAPVPVIEEPAAAVVPEPPAAAAPAPPAESPAPAPAVSATTGLPTNRSGIFESLIQSGRLDRDQVELAARLQQAGDPRRLGEILVDMGVLHPDDVLQALKSAPRQAASNAVQSSIRVDVDLLERLMNRVGELVLARNQILQITATQGYAAMPVASQRLSAITSELQESIMKTRMQPIRSLWNRLPRVVRDTATACGKEVRLEMEGADTELDRSVIEAIRDPLTHLVRNAVDHGIEDAATRAALGKPAEGRLLLRAFHEGGQVNLEVGDDGGGIAVERIRARALERGLVESARAERMGDTEWMNLIFMPGFSTSDAVTQISGRGVGMDVVKSNLERIGGMIDVESRPGQGTTMKIKIPLTLAIIPALCVRAAGEEYAIPQANLVELVRLQGDGHHAIEYVHDAPVLRLRGMLLPLVYLSHWLGVEAGPPREREFVHVAVLQTDRRQFGLVVEEVGDSREIIVKPLGRPLNQIASYAGATILGDGRAALILDVHGIARQCGIVAEAGSTLLTTEARGSADGGAAGRAPGRQPLLVFEVREGWRAAVPLQAVARLEEFEPARIERVGQRAVIQYRGGILPLVRLEQVLDPSSAPAPAAERPIPVLVCVRGERGIGFEVERVLDVEEHDVAPAAGGDRSGPIASLVIGGRVTDVFDLEALLDRVDLGPLSPPAPAASGAAA
ncbi:MAG TPA: chemotaxis protein CheW, partial [Candidatus Eisenbacteria bacterium]